MNADEARSSVRRARAAYAGWTLLSAWVAAIGVAIGVQGALGRIESPRAAVVVAPAVVWIAVWVWLCSWVAWTYRRQVPRRAASDSAYERSSAERYARVTTQYTLRDLTGVELDGLEPTTAAQFVNSQWPLVGHAAAFGLLVIALAWIG